MYIKYYPSVAFSCQRHYCTTLTTNFRKSIIHLRPFNHWVEWNVRKYVPSALSLNRRQISTTLTEKLTLLAHTPPSHHAILPRPRHPPSHHAIFPRPRPPLAHAHAPSHPHPHIRGLLLFLLAILLIVSCLPLYVAPHLLHCRRLSPPHTKNQAIHTDDLTFIYRLFNRATCRCRSSSCGRRR